MLRDLPALTIPKYPAILMRMSPSNAKATRTRSAASRLQAVLPELVLASGSQIRLSLLQGAGLSVTARPAMVDEDAVKCQAARADADPGETALLLAELKARSVAATDTIVIGADQLLVCGTQWFDKPRDIASVREHLRALRGRSHVLHTAVVLLQDGQPIWKHVETPRLSMRAFSDAALEAYLECEGEQLLGSVGAYRLEGPGIQLFDHVEGEHAAILGLPLLALLKVLRRCGLLLE